MAKQRKIINLERKIEYIENELSESKNMIEELTTKLNSFEENNDEKTKNEGKVKKKKTKKLFVIGEILFYMLLLLIIFVAFLIRSSSDGSPTSFAGYSAFTVLTSSMESEIPKGSLVITKETPEEDLEIGDDITYMANETTTITHRIIGFTENYQNTGKRAFETKGVMNEKPDKQLVPYVNVIGKVVFHSEVLGLMSNFVGNNWPIIIFFVAVIIIFSVTMKKIYTSDEEKKTKGVKKWKVIKRKKQ